MKTWLTGMLMGAALTAVAQAATVAGVVVDGRTQLPVAGATVVIGLASGASSLQTATDAGGHFAVETGDEQPAWVSATSRTLDSFGRFSMTGREPAEMAVLRIALYPKLIAIDRDFHPRASCGAFQPNLLWDRYDVTPGGRCGTPKRL